MKTKKTKKPAKPTFERIACSNWDKGEASIKIARRSKGHALGRKVLTKGEYRVELPYYADIGGALRKGYEVRLTIDGKDVVRLFPLVEQDMKTMVVSAQTMGKFRTDTYVGKKTRIVRKSGEMSVEEAKNLNDEYVHVSPDTMVECPKCGHRFRVGKKLV